MKIYSARQICDLYPNKYICVKVLEKSEDNEILKANVLRVYDSIEDCKSHIGELKFYRGILKESFDCIYGDYEDYKFTRCKLDVLKVFGGIALEWFWGLK